MSLEAFDLAWEQWTSPEGARALLDLWQNSQAKREQEKLVGRLASQVQPLRSIVEVGCGAGLLVPYLPEFKRYRGYDVSKALIAEAKERFKDDKRVRFAVHDLRDPAPYKRPVDLVICADVAVHYQEPVEVLAWVVRNWPAHHYLLSAAYGPEDVRLLNAHILSHKELLLAWQRLGTIVASDERVYGGEFMMAYALIEQQGEEK